MSKRRITFSSLYLVLVFLTACKTEINYRAAVAFEGLRKNDQPLFLESLAGPAKEKYSNPAEFQALRTQLGQVAKLQLRNRQVIQEIILEDQGLYRWLKRTYSFNLINKQNKEVLMMVQIDCNETERWEMNADLPIIPPAPYWAPEEAECYFTDVLK